MKNNKPVILILCGGQSLRLWPLSKYKSKNFLGIFGFSPLELTIKRFLKITSRDNIFLVANQKEKQELIKLKLIKRKNIILEPQSKNTAAAVLLSLLHLKKNSNANLIIAPVDHLIEKEKQFYKAIGIAQKAAQKGLICTLGIKPTKPTPNFGYIQTKKRKFGSVFSVQKFIEKPKPRVAKKLISLGNCFYNSGIFVSTVATLLSEYEKYYADYDYFIDNFKKGKILKVYKKIENIPFDKAIMEKTAKAALVKAGFSWKDFGSWQAIHEVLSKGKDKNVVKGKSLVYKGKNNFIYIGQSQKKVLVLGLEDIFFIDTKDYSLLASRAQIDELKSALAEFSKTKNKSK